eukprot:9472634-Pyramimonas_sp.AAC.1
MTPSRARSACCPTYILSRAQRVVSGASAQDRTFLYVSNLVETAGAYMHLPRAEGRRLCELRLGSAFAISHYGEYGWITGGGNRANI